MRQHDIGNPELSRNQLIPGMRRGHIGATLNEGKEMVQSHPKGWGNCYRGVTRIDGQPLLNAPVTPFKGANNLSAFCTLAA